MEALNAEIFLSVAGDISALIRPMEQYGQEAAYELVKAELIFKM
jgi:hypothetical protein